MAVVQNPIIGRARGQAGGMVFTTQFGRNVLKSKALSVANPKTDKQLGRRAAMTQTVALYRSIAPERKTNFSVRDGFPDVPYGKVCFSL